MFARIYNVIEAMFLQNSKHEVKKAPSLSACINKRTVICLRLASSLSILQRKQFATEQYSLRHKLKECLAIRYGRLTDFTSESPFCNLKEIKLV